MSFESLNRVLGSLRNQEGWQEQVQFQHLLQCWPEAVGPLVKAQTRPIGLTKQRVLRVATSSSVWAQNLAFERHRILEKLNTRLLKPLVDIRFSTGQWQGSSLRQASGLEQVWRNHPSQLPSGHDDATFKPEVTSGSQTAFTRWASQVQARSRCLPLCPKCDCPTPPGELQRWSVCALCAAKQWQ